MRITYWALLSHGPGIEKKKTIFILYCLLSLTPVYSYVQVVLPTFILERRSLLEMYADFFAHPDLFVE